MTNSHPKLEQLRPGILLRTEEELHLIAVLGLSFETMLSDISRAKRDCNDKLARCSFDVARLYL